MKKLLAVVIALCLFPARPSHADANADLAEKAIVMMEEIATIVDVNKDHCDVMGDKLNVYIDKHVDQMKKLKDAGKTLTDEQKKAFTEKYKVRAKAIVDKMTAGMTKCGQNDKVTKAMARLTPK